MPARCLLTIGRSLANDDTVAAEWYTKAAAQGHATAQYNLGDCRSYGVGVA